MVRYFNSLGLPFAESDIIKVRDPEIQKNVLGIPEQYLSGHGWHTYRLDSKDETVHFEFTHNINGRDVYAMGTLDALIYLAQKMEQGAKGKLYTMIDVLKGGA
jgi:4-hydroxy-tetrahydrodipicolinate reductase